MSRTRKGSKGPGFEYWSRRPCSGMEPGRDTKRVTHGIERAQEKELVRREVDELEATERG